MTREIITLVCGLKGQDRHTRKAVAERFGLPVCVVDDLYNYGLATLKKLLLAA